MMIFIKTIFLFMVIQINKFDVLPYPADKENFAIEIINAFKSEKFDDFKKLSVTEDIYKSSIWPKIKADTVHTALSIMQNKAINFSKNYTDDKIMTKFNYYLSLGKSIGIKDWKQVHFEYIKLSIRDNTLDSTNFPFSIFFSYNNNMFVFNGVEYTKVGDKYKLYFIHSLSRL